MKLLWNLNQVPKFEKGTVLTIGNFDGVHLGHQQLISKLKSIAEELNLPTVLILFEPQPAEFFKPQDAPSRLSSLREKLSELAKFNLDYVYCLSFNKELAKMPAEAFADKYFFTKFSAKTLLLGEDFRFGYQRQGDLSLLTRQSLQNSAKVESFADYSINKERVSSTTIRNLLKEGRLQAASLLLGRPYSICGRVIKGAEQARLWGIPTANIALHRSKPALFGVFRVKVKLKDGNLYNGVANIGYRPTLDGLNLLLEVHLFDYHANLYGEFIQVEFISKLRDEKKFSSKEELIQQIKADVAAAKAELI